MEPTSRAVRLAVAAALLLIGSLLAACADEPGGAGEKPDDNAPPAAVSELSLPPGDGPHPLARGERRWRTVELAAGDFVHVTAEQLGIDLWLELVAPDGAPTARADSPNGSSGYEELVAVAPADGSYRLVVHGPSKDAPPGEYTFVLALPAPATERQRRLVEAEEAYRQGRALRKKRPAEAVPLLQRALRLGFAEPGAFDGILARRRADSLSSLCDAYLKQGRLGLVATVCAEASEACEQVDNLISATDRLMVAGVAHLQLQWFRQAIDLLERSRELALRAERDDLAAEALIHLSTAFRALGRLQEAVEAIEQARQRLAEHDQPKPALWARTALEHGNALLSLHQPEKAQSEFRRAEELLRDLTAAKDASVVLRSELIKALSGIARAAIQLRDGEAALATAEEAIERRRRLGGSERRLAYQLNDLARALELSGDRRAARATLEEALRRAQQADDTHTEAVLLLELGQLEHDQGAPAVALAHQTRALELASAIDDAMLEASCRVRGAETLIALGRLKEACQWMEPALRAVEAVRGATARSDYRREYFAFRQEYYEIGLELKLLQHEAGPDGGHAAEALAIHERRSARELAEALRLDGDRETGPVASAQEESILRQLTSLATLGPAETPVSRGTGDPTTSGPSQTRQRTVQRNVDGTAEDLQAEIDRLVDELYRERGRPPATGREIGTAGRDEGLLEWVQGQLLDDRTLLLVWSPSPRSTLLWAIDRQRLTLHRLPPAEELGQWTDAFREAIVDRDEERRRAVGPGLAERLLGPVARRLQGVDVHPPERLLLVPGGALEELPFAALPVPGWEDAAGDADTATETYLIEDFELAQLPSLETLRQLRRLHRGRQRPVGGIAAFGDPVFGPRDARLAAGDPGLEAGTDTDVLADRATDKLMEAARSAGLDPLQRLPYSGAEIDAILALAPPGEEHLKAVGFEATRERFLATELDRYRILHLATHALVDRRHPELSFLALSRHDRRGDRLEGILPAFEIARLELPLELVVLSSCQSAVGRQLPGEGMQSLSRAFFHAGARSVVSSLWQVGDRATAELMVRFYSGYLEEGLSPAAALRQAQLAMLAEPELSDPYRWAGFQLHGEWRR